LDGVTEGKPAFLAGIQKGDVILQIGEIPILNVNDYMRCLQALNKGQKVKVIYQRPGNTTTTETEVTF